MWPLDTLLSLSRQKRKAETANTILNRALKRELEEATVSEDTGEKQTPQTVFQSYRTPTVDQLAKSTARKLNNDTGLAGDFIRDVFEDANYNSDVAFPGTGEGVDWDMFGVRPSAVSSALEWGIESVAAFAVALIEATGKSGRKYQQALIREHPDFYDPDAL